jgi:hypothetical protein
VSSVLGSRSNSTETCLRVCDAGPIPRHGRRWKIVAVGLQHIWWGDVRKLTRPKSLDCLFKRHIGCAQAPSSEDFFLSLCCQATLRYFHSFSLKMQAFHIVSLFELFKSILLALKVAISPLYIT